MRYLIFLSLLLFSFLAKAHPNMELSFFMGPSLMQNGGIEKLGDPNVNTGFQFDYFFNKKHGIGISTSNEFGWDGSTSLPTVRDASMHTFDLHYAYRHYFKNQKLRISFTPGIGWQTLYDEDQDFYWGYSYYDDLSSAWILDYKLMFDYVLQEWGDEGYESNFFLGVGVMQVFSFNDDLYGRDISGNRLSGLFRVGLGF